MLQRLIAAVLGVLGLAGIGLGVASATVWRGDDTLVVTAAPAADAGTLVITAPGVLELGGGPVTVTARADGGTKVVLAIGAESDVEGWVGTDAHTLLTGLADRHTLTTSPVAPGPEPTPAPADSAAPTDAATEAAPTEAAPTEAAGDAAATEPAEPVALAPDPDGSDLWIQQAVGEDSATLTWTPAAGRYALLVAGTGEGAAAPSVELSWPQTVTTPWFVPGIVVGAVLLLIALVLAARLWLRARRGDGDGDQADWHPVETGATAVVARDASAPTPAVASAAVGRSPVPDDAPTVVITRRQLREAAASAPTPRVAPRLSLRRRGQAAAGDAAQPTEVLPATAAPTAPAATARSAPAARPAPTGPATSGPATSGPAAWTPPPPAGSAASATGPATTPARGSRADAWRKAWGFPGEDATEPGSGETGPPAPDGTETGPNSSRTGKDS